MKPRNRPGFTLIEMFLTVAIASIVLVMAFATFRNFAPTAHQMEEKQTVAMIKAGISFYYLDPARGNVTNFPPQLDTAPAGTTASADTPLFGLVLDDPVRDNWIKVGANTWEAVSSGNIYQYQPENAGLFWLIGNASSTTTTIAPTTTTMATTTTVIVTTTTMTTTTTRTTTTTTTSTTRVTVTTSTTTTTRATVSTTTTTVTTTSTAVPAPPTVQTNAATSIGKTNATLNMTYNFGGYPTGQVQFKYKASAAPTWTFTSWQIRNGNGTYNTNQSGLTKNTLYYFVARLQYSGGQIEGSQLSFTTAP